MLKLANLSMKHCLWLVCILASAPSYASFVGSGSNMVDFTFSESGFPDSITNGVTVVNPGLELSGLDASGIGSEIMFNNEFIDIDAFSIVFGIAGGGDLHSAGYETAGWDASATYRIDFSPNTLGLFAPLTSADVVFADIIGVSLGSELMVNVGLGFISLNIGTLGIDAILDFGTVTLNFTAAPISEIPIPPTLPLMLSGLALFGYLARRKRTC